MTIINDATFDWSDPVTLAADEIWQSRDSTVYITTTSNPGATDGICIRGHEALRLSAGTVLRYRKTGTEPAEIVREAV